MFNYVMTMYFYPLFLTLLVELPIYFLFCRKNYKYFIVMTFTNIVLNLGMNLLLTSFEFEQYYTVLISLEIVVYITEGIIACCFKSVRWKGFIASICANTVSLGLGLIINNTVKDVQVFVYLSIAFGIAFLIEYAFLFWFEITLNSNAKKEKER